MSFAFSLASLAYKLLLGLACLIFFCSNAFAQDAKITGSFVNYTGIGIKSDPGPQRVIAQRDKLNLVAESSAGNFTWLAEIEFASDLGFLGETEVGNGASIEQAFVQYDTNKIKASVGLQQIPWGFANGIYILDVLSNFDLSEALTQNYEDIRKSIWSATLSYYFSEIASLDFFMSPGASSSQLPDPDSPFGANSLFGGLSQNLEYLDDDVPNRDFSDPEFAARLKINSDLWDASFSYINSFSRIPSFRLASSAGGTALVQAKYFKRQLLGANFSSSFLDPFILNLEIAYNSRQLIPVDLFSVSSLEESLIEKSLIQSLVSITNSNPFFDILLAIRSRSILDFKETLTGEQNTLGLSAIASRSILDDKMRIELNILSPDFDQYWAQLGTHYSLSDHVAVFTGFQFYGGDTSNSDLSFPLALYGERDLVFFQIGYEF